MARCREAAITGRVSLYLSAVVCCIGIDIRTGRLFLEKWRYLLCFRGFRVFRYNSFSFLYWLLCLYSLNRLSLGCRWLVFIIVYFLFIFSVIWRSFLFSVDYLKIRTFLEIVNYLLLIILLIIWLINYLLTFARQKFRRYYLMVNGN